MIDEKKTKSTYKKKKTKLKAEDCKLKRKNTKSLDYNLYVFHSPGSPRLFSRVEAYQGHFDKRPMSYWPEYKRRDI